MQILHFEIVYFCEKWYHINRGRKADGNRRVGRMIMFRECLYNDIMPFFIEEKNKDFYIRGIKEYQINNEKGYLIDTCLNSQDNYEKMVNYFLEEDNN